MTSTDSSLVNYPDADLLIRSSDDVLFRIHSANLRAHTTVFPLDINSCTEDPEPARFTEKSAVLEVLFSHLYPESELADSDLDTEDFALTLKVAYAAHKYGIVAAIRLYDLRILRVPRSSPFGCTYNCAPQSRTQRRI